MCVQSGVVIANVAGFVLVLDTKHVINIHTFTVSMKLPIELFLILSVHLSCLILGNY